MRGKLATHDRRRHDRRLIPARAGKTTLLEVIIEQTPAHPRACGENPPGTPGMGLWVGSSPRVRGKPRGGRGAPRRLRLIPARAGKTGSPSGRRGARSGSSPRVRGKRATASWGEATTGLIPARAGKTSLPALSSTPTPAHPRACGENPAKKPFYARWWGSSPRVRGKLVVLENAAPRPRLIPARAGKTEKGGGAMAITQAHPRACGENFQSRLHFHVQVGSSPRVRGKRRRPPKAPGGARLIPARAGKT